MALSALPFFRLGNHLEAAFWVIVALGFFVGAFRQEGQVRRRCWIAAITFLLFGVSDVVEAETGAWYRPAWLLLWKGACLGVMAWLLVGYVRRTRSEG